MKIITENFVKEIIDLADNFDEGNEDCYEAAAEIVMMLAKELKVNTSNKNYYVLVQWPNSQILMEHPNFNKCLFVDNIEGHDSVGSSAYMCPIEIYENIFKQS